jgi:hypothetical protein
MTEYVFHNHVEKVCHVGLDQSNSFASWMVSRLISSKAHNTGIQNSSQKSTICTNSIYSKWPRNIFSGISV